MYFIVLVDFVRTRKSYWKHFYVFIVLSFTIKLADVLSNAVKFTDKL